MRQNVEDALTFYKHCYSRITSEQVPITLQNLSEVRAFASLVSFKITKLYLTVPPYMQRKRFFEIFSFFFKKNIRKKICKKKFILFWKKKWKIEKNCENKFLISIFMLKKIKRKKDDIFHIFYNFLLFCIFFTFFSSFFLYFFTFFFNFFLFFFSHFFNLLFIFFFFWFFFQFLIFFSHFFIYFFSFLIFLRIFFFNFSISFSVNYFYFVQSKFLFNFLF